MTDLVITLPMLRRFYARLITAGLSHSGIADAFERVPRESFVGPGPWKVPVQGGYLDTETDHPAVLYQDLLVALAPESGVHNGEPSLHAKCLAAAAPRHGERVIHVGSGTGYYTAILAELVGSTGSVDAFEIVPSLAERATGNLAGIRTVQVHCRSALDADLPSADVIYVSAGATHVPSKWLDALSVGGRLVMPLTPGVGRLGFMLAVTRFTHDQYTARSVTPAGFIPCVGAQDAEEAQRLVAALAAWSPDTIRSLRRSSQPDETAWLVGSDWWLSTAEP